MSHRIVHSHGGRLELVGSEPGGATFELILPAIETEKQPLVEASALPDNAAHRVLVVDDESDVAEVILIPTVSTTPAL